MRQDVPTASTERTSVLLQQLLTELPERGDVEIGLIVRQMRRRSFGGIFLILSVLGLLPGVSFFAGLAMLVPATQFAIGFRAPMLPRFIRQREISVFAVRAVVLRIIPWLEQAEQYVKPRLMILTSPPVPIIIGGLMAGLAVTVMLPLPFSNLPPALALICFALGLIERDGIMILLGMVLSLAALSIGLIVLSLFSEAFWVFIEKRFN